MKTKTTLKDLDLNDKFVTTTHIKLKIYPTGGGTYNKIINPGILFIVKGKTARSLTVVGTDLKGVKKINFHENLDVKIILKNEHSFVRKLTV